MPNRTYQGLLAWITIELLGIFVLAKTTLWTIFYYWFSKREKALKFLKSWILPGHGSISLSQELRIIRRRTITRRSFRLQFFGGCSVLKTFLFIVFPVSQFIWRIEELKNFLRKISRRNEELSSRSFLKSFPNFWVSISTVWVPLGPTLFSIRLRRRILKILKILKKFSEHYPFLSSANSRVCPISDRMTIKLNGQST